MSEQVGSRFAILGVAGFVAPKHLAAIRETGGELVAAMDPHDSVGVLDSYFSKARFFTEIERFDRFLERLRRESGGDRVRYLSICTPNYLHDAHVRMALRLRAHAICEKPLVINPWNLDQLEDLEAEFESRVHTVLQLRLHPSVIALREKVLQESGPVLHDVCLTYVTRRGAWYGTSWKGSDERSGGLAMNIGIHFFDLLLWVFGRPERTELHVSTPRKMAGALRLERARVRWFLSVDERDLPEQARKEGKFAYRSITVDGQEIDLSAPFADLHTKVYEKVLEGNGFGIGDARPGIELVWAIRQQTTVAPHDIAHPALVS